MQLCKSQRTLWGYTINKTGYMKPRQILPDSSLHNFSPDSETALLSEVSPGSWDAPSPASSLPDQSPGKNLLPALLPLPEHEGSCYPPFREWFWSQCGSHLAERCLQLYQPQLPPWKGGDERGECCLPSAAGKGWLCPGTGGQGDRGTGGDVDVALCSFLWQLLPQVLLWSNPDNGFPLLQGTTMCVWPQGCSSGSLNSLTSFPVPTECWQLSFHFVSSVCVSATGKRSLDSCDFHSELMFDNWKLDNCNLEPKLKHFQLQHTNWKENLKKKKKIPICYLVMLLCLGMGRWNSLSCFQPDMENLPCPWCHTWFALCCFIASGAPWNMAMGFKSNVQFTQRELS